MTCSGFMSTFRAQTLYKQNYSFLRSLLFNMVPETCDILMFVCLQKDAKQWCDAAKLERTHCAGHQPAQLVQSSYSHTRLSHPVTNKHKTQPSGYELTQDQPPGYNQQMTYPPGYKLNKTQPLSYKLTLRSGTRLQASTRLSHLITNEHRTQLPSYKLTQEDLATWLQTNTRLTRSTTNYQKTQPSSYKLTQDLTSQLQTNTGLSHLVTN